MESISIVHPDNNNRTISFKFTNTTENDRDVYIKDITLYTFLRNIDWVNNIFSWVEIRNLTPSQIAHNASSLSDTIPVPVLCCVRIPPGTYKNTETIIQTINSTLSSISDPDNTQYVAIKGVDAVHNVSGSAYDIAGIKVNIDTDSDTRIPWYPAVIDSAVISNGFDISIDRTRDDHGLSSNCIPVLEFNENSNTFTVPTEGTDGYNNLLMYNYDILSKMNGSSLTSHAISFINSITATLMVDNIKIRPEDLYTSEFGLIRFRENGSNYTEFIVNPNNVALIAEIQEKYAALQITDNTITLDCLAYPFFPTSETLYIRAANTEHLDKLVESQLSSDRIFGSSIAYTNVSSEWTNRPTDGDNETLDIITSIRPQTVSINSVITVPKSSTTYIYVTGNNQRYPLWRSTHTLTYSLVN